MNRNDIDTNVVYDGEEILKLVKNNVFKEGDKLIAIQEDSLSNYVFKQYDNECYDFVDCEYPKETLDFFDLVNCKFIILLNKETVVSIDLPIGAFDMNLFIKNHNELMKKWFRNDR